MAAVTRRESQPLFVGIDGGSTKTAGAIISGAGRVLAWERGPASAIVGAPSDRARSVLSSMVDSLCEQAAASREDIASCGIGLSGIDFADEFDMQHAEVAAAVGLPQERLVLVNDGIAALWGATASPAAALFQHGSGFTSAYRSRHGEEKLFDHLSVARTFDMRQELVSLIARMINGMVAPTPLKEQALAHFGLEDEQEYCDAIYRRSIPRDLLLNTPPLIYRAWLEGDPAAASLVEKAADDYALAAKAMIAGTGDPAADAVFGGGVIERAPPEFWELLAERVRRFCPEATVKPADLAPELGAAIMAGHHAGLHPQRLFGQVLQHHLAPPATGRTAD